MKGYVSEPEEITPGLFETSVKGTDNYTVRLRLEKGVITSHVCDCPYDFGPVCKHAVAVLFHLQQEYLEVQPGSRSPKNAKAKRSKRKTVAQQLEELLDKLSHDELRQFVVEQAENNASFRRLLLSSFAHLVDNKSRPDYHREIKAILKSASDRHGFIDWHNVRHVGKAVGDMLDIAWKQFHSGSYQSAIRIACAIMEEMTEALQFADDSNADIGDNIRRAFDLLEDIASGELSDEIRKELLAYTTESFEKGIFSGWDWHSGMLDIATMLISDEKEAMKIMGLLNQMESNGSQYEIQQAQMMKLQILEKVKGEAEADKFIGQNLSNPYIRKEAIRKAVSKKQYERAISIAKDGIKQDAKDKPGLVMDWYDSLLKIALEQKDTNLTIEYARLLFVEANREKQSYYDILKAHVSQAEWGSFVEELVHDIQKKKRFFDVEVVANIYINEESWEKLMELLKRELSNGSIRLSFVAHYEKYLKKDYADDVSALYEQGVMSFMEKNIGRRHYKDACRYIRRMIKLGAKGKADRLVGHLRQAYPRRRALLKELENL